ncbi:MAG: hypothetical protein JWO30_3480 [Fibrobacteres bacterium]|nr:hypothetical protein [Fibrobacterota bacterium]
MMKLSVHSSARIALASLGLILAITCRPGHATVALVEGVVPAKHSLRITRSEGAGSSYATGIPVEVAVLEIDNNLPEYQLVLDFSDPDGASAAAVSAVRLERLDGKPGDGLRLDGSGEELEPGDMPGRFLWRPGRQESATIGLRVKVMVTYGGNAVEDPQLVVSMPLGY